MEDSTYVYAARMHGVGAIRSVSLFPGIALTQSLEHYNKGIVELLTSRSDGDLVYYLWDIIPLFTFKWSDQIGYN